MRRLFWIFLWLLVVGTIHAQKVIHIWDGTDTGSHKVTLKEYLPDKPAKTAVIVCPGGSYFWLDTKTEGDSVALSLCRQGIAAYVLRYRTAGLFSFITHYRYFFRGNQHPKPLRDVQQAINIVRQMKYDRVGVMGFSAGGHLALASAVYGDGPFCPDFVAPCYPVVTMTQPCVHKRSRRGLLGENGKRSKRNCEYMSLEKHIKSNCPPVFLMNCVDDPVVDFKNSVLADSALNAKNVPHVYVQYATGGHGFGTTFSKTSQEASSWFDAFIEWLGTIDLASRKEIKMTDNLSVSR